jgi:hypothetical protein
MHQRNIGGAWVQLFILGTGTVLTLHSLQVTCRGSTGAQVDSLPFLECPSVEISHELRVQADIEELRQLVNDSRKEGTADHCF